MATQWKDGVLEQALGDIRTNPPLHPGSRKRRAHRIRAWHYLLFLALVPLVLLLFACPMFDPAAFMQTSSAGNPKDVSTTQAQVTLAWDPPASGAASIVSYTVSFRIHGTTSWVVLGTVPASPAPTYTVLHTVVGDGNFDFAVTATDSTGATSPIHTSLDATADPNSGWYLTWGP